MDFTILAVVLLIGVGVPIRNKLIRKYRDKKKQEDNKDKLKKYINSTGRNMKRSSLVLLFNRAIFC